MPTSSLVPLHRCRRRGSQEQETYRRRQDDDALYGALRKKYCNNGKDEKVISDSTTIEQTRSDANSNVDMSNKQPTSDSKSNPSQTESKENKIKMFVKRVPVISHRVGNVCILLTLLILSIVMHVILYTDDNLTCHNNDTNRKNLFEARKENDTIQGLSIATFVLLILLYAWNRCHFGKAYPFDNIYLQYLIETFLVCGLVFAFLTTNGVLQIIGIGFIYSWLWLYMISILKCYYSDKCRLNTTIFNRSLAF